MISNQSSWGLLNYVLVVNQSAVSANILRTLLVSSNLSWNFKLVVHIFDCRFSLSIHVLNFSKPSFKLKLGLQTCGSDLWFYLLTFHSKVSTFQTQVLNSGLSFSPALKPLIPVHRFLFSEPRFKPRVQASDIDLWIQVLTFQSKF